VIWEIILRDFWEDILRSLVLPANPFKRDFPDGSHGCKANSNILNPHLFEAANTQFTGQEKAQNNSQSHSDVKFAQNLA